MGDQSDMPDPFQLGPAVYPRLGVQMRRTHWFMVEKEKASGWVCDGCGEQNEEALVMWTTGRVLRSDPEGARVVCLCDVCSARIPHGRFVDQ